MTKSPRMKKRVRSEQDAMFGIDNVLRFGRGTLINRVAAVYRAVEAAPFRMRPKLLRLTAEEFGFVDTAEKIRVPDSMSDAERDRLKERYGKTVNAMLDALIRQNLPEEDFYRGLYELLRNPFFDSRNSRIFALYYVLIDKRIPYFQLPEALRMAEDEFKDRLRGLQPLRRRIKFVLARGFEQKTEEADTILKLLYQADERERIVLFADMLHTLRSETGRARLLGGLPPGVAQV